MPAIHHAAAEDGTMRYLVLGDPASLPPVRGRDLQAAWDGAREAAIAAAAGPGCAVRFVPADAAPIDVALRDRDARCWAAAADRLASLSTAYGMSVCLRLLALIDLLRAPWARPLCALRRGGAVLDPALLRLAAEAALTDDARFDERAFRARLTPRLAASATARLGTA